MQLPQEIYLDIMEYCEVWEIINLSQTCKNAYYASKYFSDKINQDIKSINRLVYMKIRADLLLDEISLDQVTGVINLSLNCRDAKSINDKFYRNSSSVAKIVYSWKEKIVLISEYLINKFKSINVTDNFFNQHVIIFNKLYFYINPLKCINIEGSHLNLDNEYFVKVMVIKKNKNQNDDAYKNKYARFGRKPKQILSADPVEIKSVHYVWKSDLEKWVYMFYRKILNSKEDIESLKLDLLSLRQRHTKQRYVWIIGNKYKIISYRKYYENLTFKKIKTECLSTLLT